MDKLVCDTPRVHVNSADDTFLSWIWMIVTTFPLRPSSST